MGKPKGQKVGFEKWLALISGHMSQKPAVPWCFVFDQHPCVVLIKTNSDELAPAALCEFLLPSVATLPVFTVVKLPL